MKAVTFDFWWTLFVDGQGEAGASVRDLRLSYIRDIAWLKGKEVTRKDCETAFFAAREFFKQRHTKGIFTSPEKFTERIFSGIDVHLSPAECRNIAGHLSYLGKYMKLIPVDGSIETLQTLKSRGYRIGLISDTVLTTGRYLTDFLRKYGMLKYFDFLVFSDRVEMVKPDRGVFLYAARKLGIEPEQAIHVGDFPWSDIEGALKAGFTAVQFTGADGPEKENVHPRADHVIENLADLCKILG